jgi:hypothetical protein
MPQLREFRKCPRKAANPCLKSGQNQWTKKGEPSPNQHLSLFAGSGLSPLATT